jgi:hypothetical protein
MIDRAIIADTAFNIDRYNTMALNFGYQALNPNHSEALVKDALQNITMSIIYALGKHWDKTTPVTQSKLQSILHFSSRARLVAPYVFCLLAALPVLALSMYSLWRNDVLAADGGFLQPPMTTTGSERLREAAAAGCLGGAHDVPVALKELKIRYGKVFVGERKAWLTGRCLD